MESKPKHKGIVRFLKRFAGLLLIGLVIGVVKEYMPFGNGINDFSVASMVNDTQSKLPIVMDEGMTYTSIAVEDKTINHTFTLSKEYQQVFNVDGQKKSIKIHTCFSDESENDERFFQAGYSFKYTYLSKEGSLVGAFNLNNDVCSEFKSRDLDGLGNYLSDEYSKVLPLQYSADGWTVEARYENGTLRIANLEQGLLKEEIDMEYFSNELKQLYRVDACKMPDVWALMYQGGKIQYNFFDANEESIGVYEFAAGDCKDVREAIDELLK